MYGTVVNLRPARPDIPLRPLWCARGHASLIFFDNLPIEAGRVDLVLSAPETDMPRRITSESDLQPKGD